MFRHIWLVFAFVMFWSTLAHTEEATREASAAASSPVAVAKVEPYRTFVTIQRYTMENNGNPSTPISNVRIAVQFPNGTKLQLPEGEQWWPIGNGQAQEINRTFEIPFSAVANDGFRFVIQMERKGSKMLPCEFNVLELSAFNRAYTCHTDIGWQTSKNVPESEIDREGIQVRVFTTRNLNPNEIPTDAIALR